MNKIKLTMTDELAEKNHRTLWNWVAETGEHKHRAPISHSLDKFNYQGILDGALLAANEVDCFACGEAYIRGKNSDPRNNCKHCPINWNGRHGHCTDYDSPYIKYYEALTGEEAKKYAAIIANLPWKKRGE